MAVGLAVPQADGILDSLLGAIFVKLHTGSPGAAGTTNAAGETTRKSVSFASAAAGSAASSSDAAWTSVSDSESYRFVSLWDDVSAGNLIATAELSNAPRTVTAGDDFTIASGDLTVSLTVAA